MDENITFAKNTFNELMLQMDIIIMIIDLIAFLVSK